MRNIEVEKLHILQDDEIYRSYEVDARAKDMDAEKKKYSDMLMTNGFCITRDPKVKLTSQRPGRHLSLIVKADDVEVIKKENEDYQEGPFKFLYGETFKGNNGSDLCQVTIPNVGNKYLKKSYRNDRVELTVSFMYDRQRPSEQRNWSVTIPLVSFRQVPDEFLNVHNQNVKAYEDQLPAIMIEDLKARSDQKSKLSQTMDRAMAYHERQNVKMESTRARRPIIRKKAF